MFEKFLYRITDNLAERLLVCGVVVSIPIGIIGSWLGAAYNQVYAGVPFRGVLTGLFFGGFPLMTLGAFLVLYPFERWIVRDRAMNSWKWVVIRIVYYMLAGIPEGYATQVGIHLSLWEFPRIIESIFYVQAVVGSVTFGVLYTLVERAVAEVRKREAAYKLQIDSLRIEINALKREQQVKEIVETDFFNELQRKAHGMRQRAEETS